MRNNAPGMSPEKIAMAVAVTMAAMAGTGGMKKVMGTNKAVAMVAVNPGMQPTNKPNNAEHKMTSSTYGSNTNQKAWLKTARVMSIAPYHCKGIKTPQGSGTRRPL